MKQLLTALAVIALLPDRTYWSLNHHVYEWGGDMDRYELGFQPRTPEEHAEIAHRILSAFPTMRESEHHAPIRSVAYYEVDGLEVKFYGINGLTSILAPANIDSARSQLRELVEIEAANV